MQPEKITKFPEAKDFQAVIENYKTGLQKSLEEFDWTPVHELAAEFLDCIKTKRSVFVCGNGGSGANAVHIANDFLYGVAKTKGIGLRCHALSANPSVITCLANDEGYENIFSYQLAVQANPGDVLLVLSGSGNSPNILEAIKTAKEMGVKTYGILGYSGGKAKDMVETPIHFSVNDMQISEDLQMITANMVLQWLYAQSESLKS